MVNRICTRSNYLLWRTEVYLIRKLYPFGIREMSYDDSDGVLKTYVTVLVYFSEGAIGDLASLCFDWIKRDMMFGFVYIRKKISI